LRILYKDCSCCSSTDLLLPNHEIAVYLLYWVATIDAAATLLELMLQLLLLLKTITIGYDFKFI
jgi:hypothetical protein